MNRAQAPSAPVLRPYQARAIVQIRTAVLSGTRRLLLCAPTGSGKTVTVGELVRGAVGLGTKVLIVVHRLELVTQMVDTLGRFGVSAGIIKAGVAPEPIHPVQVGTVQSLIRRDLPRAGLVIVDEAHRASADSYERVRAAYPNAVYLGLTATPCRENGRPLGDVFDALVEVATYSDLIADGSIVEPTCYGVAMPPDLAGVKVRAGDYVVGELEVAMNRTELVGGIVENWQRLAGGRRTLVFAVGVAHSKAIAAAFAAADVAAAHLDGETGEAERAETLGRFARGEITVLSNCALFIEGLDIPAAKCAVLARPTKSLALFMQGAGRVLRPWGDVAPIVLDHAGNIARHGLPHEDRAWSLTEAPRRKSAKAPYKTCPKCFGYIDAGDRLCPLCGHSFVVAAAEPAQLPTETKAMLERIDRAAMAQARAAAAVNTDVRRQKFDVYAERARRMGFKPGFASAKWKEEFGAWPPWDWSQTLKTEFAQDGEWQARQAHRETERAHWQSIADQRLRNTPEAVAEETAALDETLSGWLAEQKIG